MKKYIFVIFLISLAFVQCNKKEEQILAPDHELPPATTIGASKIGCLVNGKPWRPQPFLCGFCFYGFLEIIYDRNRNVLTFHTEGIDKLNKMDNTIHFTIDSPKLGNNIINYSESIFYNSLKEQNGSYYELHTAKPHNLVLTKVDSVNRIISGTFEFTGINKKLKDTVSVTYGRFDGGRYTTGF